MKRFGTDIIFKLGWIDALFWFLMSVIRLLPTDSSTRAQGFHRRLSVFLHDISKTDSTRITKRDKCSTKSRVRVDHFNYPTRAENFYPTRPAGISVPVAYPYDYRTVSFKPMARGGTARVTSPNVIWLHFDRECRRKSTTWRKVDWSQL